MTVTQIQIQIREIIQLKSYYEIDSIVQKN